MSMKAINGALAGLAALAAAGLPARAEYSDSVLALDPVAYYALDETTQPSVDIAKNAGTLATFGDGEYRGANGHPVGGALAGSGDTAATFSGGGVFVPHAPELNPFGPFTAEFWVKPGVALADAALTCPFASIEVAGTSRSGWLFYQTATGWNFRVGDGGGYKGNVTGAAVTPGVWQHVAGVYDGANITLYVDGAASGTAAVASFAPNPFVPLGIGLRGDNTFQFTGAVDEAAVHGRALTGAEVAAHYANGVDAGRATPYEALVSAKNPVGYWRLNEADARVFAANSSAAGASLNAVYEFGTTPGSDGVPLPGMGAANKAAGMETLSGVVVVPPLNLNTNQATFLAWIKPSGAQASFAGLIFTRAGGTTSGLGFTEGGQIGYHWNDAAATYNFRSNLYPPEFAWSLVAMVVDAEKAVFYLHDGFLFQSSTNFTLHSPASFTGPTMLGTDSGNTARKFVGAMDGAAIFNRALGADEILSLYYAATDNQAPEIRDEPTAPTATIYQGASFSLRVSAAGTPPLTYIWSNESGPLPNGDKATYVKESATPGDSGNYSVVIKNAFGEAASQVVPVVVEALAVPMVTTPPQALTRHAGGSAVFSVAAEGAPPLAYQWFLKGVELPGETNSTLRVTDITAAKAGAYGVRVSNPAGSAPLASGELTVVEPEPNSYTAAVMASKPVAFWRLGETASEIAVDIAGGHDAPYQSTPTLGSPGAIQDDPDTSVTFDGFASRVEVPHSPSLNGATFSVEVWAKVVGGAGSYRSPLTSRDDLPQRGYIFYATPGDIWEFWTGQGTQDGWSVIAGPAVAYSEWTHLVATHDGVTKRFYVNGVLAGSNTAPFGPNDGKPLRIGGGATDNETGNFYFPGEIDEVAVYDKALSQAEISLHFGTAFGASTPPQITQQPAGGAFLAGDSTTLSVVASGSLPLTYEWRRDGQVVPNETGPELVLTDLSGANAGPYTVLVKNLAGQALSDPPAVVTVVAPPDKAYAAVVAEAAPVAYYRLGESAGAAVAEDSAGSLDGEALNGVGFGLPGALPMDSDTSASFTSATQQKIEVFWAPEINGANGLFTIELWAKVTGGSGHRSPLSSRGDFPQAGYIIYAEPGNTWQFWTGTGEQVGWNIIGGPAIAVGEWTHLAGTYDGAVKRFYVNGRLVGSNTSLFGPNWANPLRIGAGQNENPTGTFFFEGGIDEVAIYDKALTHEQLLIHYAVGAKTAAPPELSIAWAGGQVVLTYANGTLQEADAVTGVWADVAAASPVSVPAAGAGKFYRVKR